MAKDKSIVVSLDTEQIEDALAAVRLSLSQIGFALDTLVVSLREIRAKAALVPANEETAGA